MKNLIFIGLLLGIMQLSAQENIEIKVKERAVNGAMQPAFMVDIPQISSKDAIKLWEKTLVPKSLIDNLKKMPKMEKEEKNKWVMKDIIVDKVSPDTFNIYTRIDENDSGIAFAALFEKNGEFIGKDSKKKETEKAKSYVRKFAVEAYRQSVQGEWEDLQKEVKKMQKQYSNLENDNNKIDRQTVEVKSSLDRLNEELTEKRKTYNNGGELADGELKSTLSDEAKEQLSESIKTKEKEIKKAKKQIEKYARNVDKNKSKQEELTRSIEETKTKIESVKTKLENIK